MMMMTIIKKIIKKKNKQWTVMSVSFLRAFELAG